MTFKTEHNIVYGMVSGTALLGDLYMPDNANGLGLIHISGSGWHAEATYNTRPLKESSHVDIYVKPLAAQGFTVFTINHRAAPRFHYPDALEDAQRAVRHFRYHADGYGIQADRIGAIGGSSGGHLVSLLGALADDGISSNEDGADDSIGQTSAAVQCVVARAPVVDLLQIANFGKVVSFMGRPLEPLPIVEKLYREASPVSHITEKTPPFLLIHGTADDVVPMEQSITMQQALEKHGVANRLIEVEGAGHGPGMPGAINPPDLISEIAAWFHTHLDIVGA